MAKINLPSITSGYATTTQLNNALDQIESEFQNKVLYRNNPTGEPNQMEVDIDMNNNKLLNVQAIEVNGQDLIGALSLFNGLTISTSPPSGGSDGDIWFQVSS